MPDPGGRTLVTGALGCLGAWTLKALVDLGEEPVGFDLGSDDARLQLALSEEERGRVTLVEGDVTDGAAVGRALDEHGITHVVHLAALQVPFCRADPERGARVNVHGTVVVFEAVKARLGRIRSVAYASSTAVYNASDPSPAPESGGTAPSTLYGVFKLANEGTARVYWDDDDVASIGIRPYVVYGPGRDQGLTSGPSLAMEAAARGDGYTIAYGGTAQYDFAPDVGRAFALAARAATRRRARRELPGRAVDDAGGRRRDRGCRAGGRGQGVLGGGPAPVPRVAAGKPPRAPRRPAPAHVARGRRARDDRALPRSRLGTGGQLAGRPGARGERAWRR